MIFNLGDNWLHIKRWLSTHCFFYVSNVAALKLTFILLSLWSKSLFFSIKYPINQIDEGTVCSCINQQLCLVGYWTIWCVTLLCLHLVNLSTSQSHIGSNMALRGCSTISAFAIRDKIILLLACKLTVFMKFCVSYFHIFFRLVFLKFFASLLSGYRNFIVCKSLYRLFCYRFGF